MISPAMTPEERDALMKTFGVRYFMPGETGVYESPPDNLYHYTAYHGDALIDVEKGDSVVILRDEEAVWMPGPVSGRSTRMAVVVRGYKPDTRVVGLGKRTALPYVNGCSTRQLFPPERLGDPTLQLLDIPPFSAEQAHHIHSTVRVVHILKGRGRSIVGMEGGTVVQELVEGMTIVLEPMCPHHFDTPQGEHLICVPFHVYSSIGAAEHNHPMFNGTHLMNQGE